MDELLPFQETDPDFANKIKKHIIELLMDGQNALISWLYRMDIPEKDVREAIRLMPTVNAEDIISELVIKRLHEKLRSRRENHNPDPPVVDGTDFW